MALTLANTNNAGEMMAAIYTQLDVGNEVANKKLMKIFRNEQAFINRAKMTQTKNPMVPFVTGVPGADSVTTSYSEQQTSLKKYTIYETFTPHEWTAIWKVFAPNGSFSDLKMNPKLMTELMRYLSNGVGTQFSKLVFQGDTAGAAGLNIVDGWIKLLDAAGDAIVATNVGVPAAANIVAITQAVHAAILSKNLDKPGTCILMSTTNKRLLETANIELHKAFTGVLDQRTPLSYLGTPIKWIEGIPNNRIFAGVIDTSNESNLYGGYWIEPNREMSNIRIGRGDERSEEWFYRINGNIGVGAIGTNEVVSYTGA